MEDARSEQLRARPVDEDALSVELAKARDPVVWSRWFDGYYPLLFRYASVRLGNREEAADVASQVFVEAIRAIDRYTYRGRPVLAWLYRIAANLVSSRRRLAGRTVSHELVPESGFDSTDGQIENLALREAILSLTDDQRDVITLTFVIGLPPAEVAQVLGKKVATVYSLQARAMTNLRRMLAD